MTLLTQLQGSVDTLKQHYPHAPEVAVILGSGLGDVVDSLPNLVKVPFADIPHFPHSSVSGHHGAMCFAKLPSGVHVVYLQGRVHYYEGHPIASVVYPIRVLQQLGVKTLIVTNAAGGINTAFQPGDLMLITDHINLMGNNPLIGENFEALGPRFLDMSQAYSPNLRTLALQQAEALKMPLQQGVYCTMSGPSYETPAEVRMLRTLGADAVGMSTVPEVIVARHGGMNILGISCITNAAAGVIQNQVLNHEEVLTTAQASKVRFGQLLQAILNQL